jgi:hypothetical protein
MSDLALTFLLITSPIWAPIAVFILAVGFCVKAAWEGIRIQINGV